MAGVRPEAAPGGGTQESAPQAVRHADRARDAARRSASRARGDLAERVSPVRPGRGRRPRAGVDGVHRRGDAAGASEPLSALGAQGGERDRLSAVGGTRGDPPGGSGAPRHQARERDADPHAPGGDHGLRSDLAERGGFDGRDPGVHASGAGARRAGGCAGGRVLGGDGAGGDAVGRGGSGADVTADVLEGGARAAAADSRESVAGDL